MNDSCVELKNVGKRFPGVTAVDNISLRIPTGKVTSLLGPSGCGKTTVLRLVAGLEAADNGQILIDRQVVNDIPPYRRECTMVFQNLAVFPHMTVGENIAYGLHRRKVPKQEIKGRIHEMLALIKLPDISLRYPTQLSGGQLQRVALARSLVLRPKILLLDEPLASLDRKLRKEMQIELKRIQREVGITFLYVTHDQKVALSISDVIAVMNQGKIEQLGTPTEIFETPRTDFVADFMGASNILYGTVRSHDSNNIQLKTRTGFTVIASVSSEMDLKEISGISVRPEVIHLTSATGDLRVDNKYEGEILEVVYQGEFVEVLVCLKDGETLLRANVDSRIHQRHRFAPGVLVQAGWNSSRSNILTA
jgi:spermidine/putrescine transport system ATP-binding protein